MKHKSLSASFLLRILLVVLVGQACLLGWTYYVEQSAMEAEILAKARIAAGMLVSSGEKALVEFDANNVGLLMDQTLKDPDFIKLQLFDDRRYPVMERIGTGTRLNTLEFPIRRGSERIGTLTITYSTARVHQQLIYRVMGKMLVMAAAIFALIAVVVLFFRKRVMLRVVHMDTLISRMTEGDLTARVSDSYGDEMTRVAVGINFLVERLSRTVTRITTMSEQVFATTNSLLNSFDESTSAMVRQHSSTEDISRAIGNVSQSQSQISVNTATLHRFSEENSEALQQTMEKVQDIACQVDQLSNGMNEANAMMASLEAGTRKVSALAAQATEGIGEAVASAGDVRSSIGEVTRLITLSAEQTDRTARIVAEHGINSYQEAQDTMARIDGLSHSLTRTIGRLGEESKDIAKILAVISDVTERTKLLSLNASIIAAQSGEHGKGFAVVAQEMKLLSDQTAESTKSIVAILNGIQEGIGEAVEEARQASHTVKEGLAAVTVAGEALQEILDSSHGSSAMVREIMNAAARQQTRLEEILTTMSVLQRLNSEVSRAMADEGGNIAELTRTFDILCESMDAARRAIEWQVATLKDVMGNVVAATSQTSGIARELEANDAENKAIDSSVQAVVAITARTTETLNTASGKLLDVVSQMELLVQEVKQLRT